MNVFSEVCCESHLLRLFQKGIMSHFHGSAQYVLGIDLGTTSVKAVLLESMSKKIASSETRPTKAEVLSDLGPQAKEQDVGRIVNALNECMAVLPKDQLQKVVRIGVSGQMHGVVFWNAEAICDWQSSGTSQIFKEKTTSNLITWQDGRCSAEFLASLPQPDSHLSLASGFGCASIFWILKNRPDVLKMFTSAGTIQDYLVAMLCNQERPLMSVQNAASWGYFNTQKRKWNLEILRNSDFPVYLLPEVVESGSIAGKTTREWHLVPVEVEVGVALGDFQCSVYSCMRDKTDAVLNIGTSAQLTFALPSTFQPPKTPDCSSPLSYFPYFDGSYLAVAASLNGGNVLAVFVEMLKNWINELGLEVNESSIYSLLSEAALNQSRSDLTIWPTIFGERHDTKRLGSVCNISTGNISLGHVGRALCHGVVQNLVAMLPPTLLLQSGVQRILGTGNALSRNEVLKQEIEKTFPLPVQYCNSVDSAVGVAMIFDDGVVATHLDQTVQ
ncbi:sedoheptulokinase [Polypterus senegalus]|uniref:sedoheptulokinase n=1 Tax=Polypterus senegalus TaxID=55291 RepID=UPI0019667CD2|nr:sedoheptulokinase [Polypterus senegalus]